MENWGMISYEESSFLVGDKTSKAKKVEAVSTVFHEIAVSFLMGAVGE